MTQLTINSKIRSILDKALAGQEIDREQTLQLLKIDEKSPEMYAVTSAANVLTRRQYGDRGSQNQKLLAHIVVKRAVVMY